MSLDTLRQWWARRVVRERALMTLVALVAIVFAVDSALLKPVRLKIADARLHLVSARSELDKLQRIVEERDRAGNENLRLREASLQARLSAAESQIHRAQIELISPQDMARQLSVILRKFPSLRVVGMTTDAPALVEEGADKGGKAAVSAEARRTRLYQHGLELTIEGSYTDLVSYLDQLEHAPYKIYWRELDLKVDPKGQPVTRVRFFTLSRGPTWMTL
jgi:MSHA biogenesis protein MshJ